MPESCPSPLQEPLPHTAPQSTSRRVLFLCTANYYRSRYAESFFNHLAEHVGLAWRADSRGLGVGMWGNLGPISRFTLAALQGHGVRLGEDIRMPQQVTLSDLAEADLVIALKQSEHQLMVEAQFPEWVERIVYWQIDDLDCAEPEIALPALERRIRELITRLQAESESDPSAEDGTRCCGSPCNPAA